MEKIHEIQRFVNVLDLGYLGVEKDFLAEQISSLPYKKKKNQQELSIEEKEYNKDHSKRRIVIEHTICRLKKYRIMSDILETN
ncbi:MAG: transposase family protein [Candidatus Nitrosocosmicus sp.]